MIVAIK